MYHRYGIWHINLLDKGCVTKEKRKFGTILMAADPPRQASKMGYLRRKRLNYIQQAQNLCIDASVDQI